MQIHGSFYKCNSYPLEVTMDNILIMQILKAASDVMDLQEIPERTVGVEKID